LKEEKKYSAEDIKSLPWHEHIRLRPGMYIGYVDIRGFVQLFKGILSVALEELEAESISFEMSQPLTGTVAISGIKKSISDNWSRINPKNSSPYGLQFETLNGLSESFTITLYNQDSNVSINQNFVKGQLTDGEDFNENQIFTDINVKFTLDEEIWGSDFRWKEDFVRDEIRELAYLHSGKTLVLKHSVNQQESKSVYFYQNGLYDRLENEKLKGLGGCYFDTHIIDEDKNIKVEIAFAFRNYSVDENYIRSYCNDYYTSENGSHVDGLLKGLTYGVMKYFQKHELTDKYKISEKGIEENVVALINIRMDSPEFSGCVKNKLASPHVVQPIADIVSKELFKRIEKDEESTQHLISKFEMNKEW